MDTRRRHILYPAPIATTPSVMLIDIPEAVRGADLALGRYYPIIVEPMPSRPSSSGSSATPSVPPPFQLCSTGDRRRICTDAILVVRYDPPEPAWPWLSLTCWPDALGRLAASHNVEMARGRYSMEAFAIEAALCAHNRQMIDLLSAQHPVEICLIAADDLPAGGHA